MRHKQKNVKELVHDHLTVTLKQITLLEHL